MKQRICQNLEETILLGEKIGLLLDENALILLKGDLGAGKTTFTKGIAKGLGITETVNSPTFTILKSYEGKYPLHHIDAYRLEGIEQSLGFEEQISDGICVIEWPDFLPTIDKKECLIITIQLLENGDRLFTFEEHGEKYKNLLKEII